MVLVNPDTEKAGDIFHRCVRRDLRVHHVVRSFLHRVARPDVILFMFIVICARRGGEVAFGDVELDGQRMSGIWAADGQRMGSGWAANGQQMGSVWAADEHRMDIGWTAAGQRLGGR